MVVAVAGAVPAAAANGGGQVQAAWTVSAVAGGVGGPARATTVALAPCGVTSAAGSVYTVTGSTVRKVSSAGWLTTPAGTGAAQPLGDGGLASRASLDSACGVTVDRSGNLVIADTTDNRVRVVVAATGNFYGQAMIAKHIYTVAGNGIYGFSGDGGPATRAELSPYWVAVNGAGDLLISDSNNNRVLEVAG